MRSGRASYRPTGAARRSRVASRPEWRGLIEQAQACVADANADAVGPNADLRLAALANRVNAASTEMFKREAGQATVDAAEAFARVARAFSRRETPSEVRLGLAPSLADLAAFLDQQLTRLADRDFEQAHRGRPEVWG